MELTAMDNRKSRKVWMSLVLGGVAGFAVALGVTQLFESEVLGQFSESRVIAALVGSLLLLCGLFVGIGVINPSIGAKFLNVEDADELREQQVLLRYSTLGVLALGIMMFCLALAAPAGPLSPIFVLVIAVFLVALTFFTSKRQLAASDELMRSVSQETASSAFYGMFVVGGGWAMLTHLGYIKGPQALDWVTMFVAATLISTFWVCGRRGLLTPR